MPHNSRTEDRASNLVELFRVERPTNRTIFGQKRSKVKITGLSDNSHQWAAFLADLIYILPYFFTFKSLGFMVIVRVRESASICRYLLVLVQDFRAEV